VARHGVRISVVALVLALVGVSIPALAASHLPYGPGPLAHYIVQPQPAAGSCHYRYTTTHQPLPDRACTSGALNPKVTERTIGTTICRSGYTSTIRPPESVTEPEKLANARSYGYRGSLSVAEYDHLVPLELGGDPNDPSNLWVEPPSPGHKASQGVYNPKDEVENQARSLVCAHEVGLTAMQNAIAANWTTAIAAVTRAGGGHRGPLGCSARVSDASPAQYSAVVVSVSTRGNAAVTTTAHYKTKDTVKTTTASASGAATVFYDISGATVGFTVVVTVSVSVGAARGSCKTQFTPR